jgi:integrase
MPDFQNRANSEDLQKRLNVAEIVQLDDYLRRHGRRELAPPVPLAFEEHLAHTADHLNCPACGTLNQEITIDLENMAELPFGEAIDRYLAFRKLNPRWRPRTHTSDVSRANALKRFFSKIPCKSVTPGMLKAYQMARAVNQMYVGRELVHPWERTAQAMAINHEIALLGRVLKACKLWAALKPYYFPLEIPEWSPREILSEPDEEKFFRLGAGDPVASLAYCVAVLTNNTTLSGMELRLLKLEHVLWGRAGEPTEVYVPPECCKNHNRPRKVALNKAAEWALQVLYARAMAFGASSPHHHLFPFTVNRHKHDPSRPASPWYLRKSWNRLREITGIEDINPHDFRHHAITRLLEAGVADAVVEAMAGHVSKKMREYYSHLRTRTLHDAALAIERSYDPEKFVVNAKKNLGRIDARLERNPAHRASQLEGSQSAELDLSRRGRGDDRIPARIGNAV